MSKSKKLIDRLAKLIEEGLLTSKDIGDEIKNSLNYKKESIINKLNLVTRDEFEIQKARLDKIQKEFGKFKKRKKKLKRQRNLNSQSFLWACFKQHIAAMRSNNIVRN